MLESKVDTPVKVRHLIRGLQDGTIERKDQGVLALNILVIGDAENGKNSANCVLPIPSVEQGTVVTRATVEGAVGSNEIGCSLGILERGVDSLGNLVLCHLDNRRRVVSEMS
jgi:hypothetical protein